MSTGGISGESHLSRAFAKRIKDLFVRFHDDAGLHIIVDFDIYPALPNHTMYGIHPPSRYKIVVVDILMSYRTSLVKLPAAVALVSIFRFRRCVLIRPSRAPAAAPGTS